jgi:hypothetical protein
MLFKSATAQSDLGLRSYSSTLQAQNVPSAKQFLSFKERKTYNLLEASFVPHHIDLIFMYGNNTGLNLITPSSNAMGGFGPKYKINVHEGWDNKREGSLMVIRDIVKVQMQFEKINSLSELKELFYYYELNISSLPGYNGRDFGPTENTSRMDIGDIVLFKSFSSENLYAIGKVVSAKKSHNGEMTIDWKIPKKIK